MSIVMNFEVKFNVDFHTFRIPIFGLNFEKKKQLDGMALN